VWLYEINGIEKTHILSIWVVLYMHYVSAFVFKSLSTSGRPYLSGGGQQDMEELLRTLLLELEREIRDDDGLFTPIIHEFWGKEVTVRKFVDTPDGKCNKCQMYPSVSEDKFLTVKLKVPSSNHSIFLSTLIANYYSESSDQMMLRCGNCCNHTTGCPQTGNCKSHNAVTQLKMSRSPKYLIVQLMRFENVGDIKIDTTVLSDKVLQLPTHDKYELITVSSHIGATTSSGHYVTSTNLHNLTWTLCDDTNISAISSTDINSQHDYIYVYQRIPPNFVPKTFWQEVLPGQAVPAGSHVKMDMNTGKQFAKLNNGSEQSNLVQNADQKTNLESSPRKCEKTCESGKLKKRKMQVGNFEKELNECKKCKRKFVNLKMHHASGNCFQNETSQSIPEGNANNINKDKSCPPPKGSNNSFKSGECSEKSNSLKESTSSSEPQNIACKGCSKVYKRLLVHLKSKNGHLCKSFYSPEELDKPNKWKAYYEKNKKKILEKQKEYQKQNAEKNSEKIKIAKKKHYDENAEKIKS
jgi:hypothetical protein